jgi:eukaryotic-like serine/threonine-protein kinase
MGVVFEARDRVRGQRVALKTLRRTDPHSLYLFKREFRLLADLRHPNLVTLGELVHDGGRWFFTMELVDGLDFRAYCGVPDRARSVVAETSTELTDIPPSSRTPPSQTRPSSASSASAALSLTSPGERAWAAQDRDRDRDRARERLGRDEAGREPERGLRFAPARVRHALVGLCSGLAALHAAGKVHRDLKPANVLVTASGRVVLLDFGLVSELGEDGLAKAGGRSEWGTPRYMAPEVVNGRAGPAADLYALGVMLYDVLTGQPPFGGSGEPVLLAKTLREAIPPSAWAPNLPHDLEALTLRLLRRDPEERPTAEELLRELGAVHTSSRTLPLLARVDELAQLDRALAEVNEQRRPALVVCEGSAGLGKTRLVTAWLDRVRESSRQREGGDVDAPASTREPGTPGADGPPVGTPLVLASVSYEDSAVPFQALDSAVDGLAEWLAEEQSLLAQLAHPVSVCSRVFPVLGRALPAEDRAADRPTSESDRGAAFSALAEILHGIAAQRPIVLFLDDAHWADADSSLLLATVLESAVERPLALLVVAASRPREPGAPPRPLLAALAMLPFRRTTIALRPLPAELAEQEIQAVYDAVGCPAAEVTRLLSVSAGHPLAFAELVRHRSGGSLGSSACFPSLLRGPGMEEGPAGTFEDALGRRLAGLGRPSRELLAVVALSRSPLPLRVAAAAAGLADPEIERERLVAASLLRVGGVLGPDGVDVAHDRVRTVVLATLTTDGERRLHRELAEAMRHQLPDQPDRIADHLVASGDALGAEPYLLRAAEVARTSLAFARAAELYRRAVRGRPVSDAARARFLELQGDCEALAGHGLAAAEAFLAAAQAAGRDGAGPLDRHRDQDLRRRAAEQLLVSGRQREGMRILRDVCRAVGLTAPVSPAAAAPLFLIERGRLALRGEGEGDPNIVRAPVAELRINAVRTAARSLSIVDTMTAAYYQAVHLRLSLDSGDPAHLLYAYGLSTGFAAAEEGSTGHRAVAYLERNRALVAASNDRLGPPTLALSESVMAYCHGDFPRSIAAAERALAGYRAVGGDVVWDVGTGRTFRFIAMGMTGDLTNLAAEAAEAQREADLRRDLYSTSFFQTGALPWIDLAIGDPHFARQRLRRAVERHRFPGFSWAWFLSRIHLALIEVQADDPAAAHAVLDGLRAPPVPLLVGRFRFHRLFAIWARGIVSARALERAPRSLTERARLRRAIARLESDGEPYARAWAASLRPAQQLASSSTRAGYERAASQWEQAGGMLDSLGFSLFAAACFARAGEALTRAGAGFSARRETLAAQASARFRRAGVQVEAPLVTTLAPGLPRR